MHSISHNPKVVSSSLTPATTSQLAKRLAVFLFKKTAKALALLLLFQKKYRFANNFFRVFQVYLCKFFSPIFGVFYSNGEILGRNQTFYNLQILYISVKIIILLFIIFFNFLVLTINFVAHFLQLYCVILQDAHKSLMQL